MHAFQTMILPAVFACFMLAAPLAHAEEADMPLPFVGEYQLQTEGNAGEMSIRFEDDQFFHVAVFTTTDEGLHFCDYTGRFVQEEKVLVEEDPPAGELPLIIYDQGDYLEIQEDTVGACGLNQTMVGRYHPVPQ